MRDAVLLLYKPPPKVAVLLLNVQLRERRVTVIVQASAVIAVARRVTAERAVGQVRAGVIVKAAAVTVGRVIVHRAIGQVSTESL